MRAALYARVSSEEQVEGYSIDAQLRAGRNFSQEKGWTVVNEYVDEGKSARSEDISRRPKFREMLRAAKDREFDVLIVHKLDRFSRSLMVTLKSFEELSKNGVTFISITEQIDYTTPMGKVFLAMAGAIAQFYSDNLSQETKKGWAQRREQGLYCGTLPFGAMTDDNGIPIADMQERKISIDSHEMSVRNYEGLKMAYELAAQGKSDREVAMALNASGYRTTGTHGSKPFSKDTVKDMLKNRFYLGYIQDGNDGWLKAKHEPFIDQKLFEVVQEMRSKWRSPRQTINVWAKTYSLSYIARCARCGGNIRMRTDPRGKARAYCASRAEGDDCDFKGTFLDTYERQIEWYLENFTIPTDYQRKILAAHKKLRGMGDDDNSQRKQLKAGLERLKQQYRWGHISQEEYQREHGDMQYQIQQLLPMKNREEEIERLAQFLANVANAWRQANQKQRNKLSRVLFDEVKLDSGGKVIAVRPRAEMEPFFKLSYDCHVKVLAGDPGGI